MDRELQYALRAILADPSILNNKQLVNLINTLAPEAIARKIPHLKSWIAYWHHDAGTSSWIINSVNRPTLEDVFEDLIEFDGNNDETIDINLASKDILKADEPLFYLEPPEQGGTAFPEGGLHAENYQEYVARCTYCHHVILEDTLCEMCSHATCFECDAEMEQDENDIDLYVCPECGKHARFD